VARIVNIYVVTLLFKICRKKSKWRLNRYELQIVFASGLVKGAVPFALTTSTVLIETPVKVTSLIIKSTVIIIVLFTNLVVNGILPTFIRNRLKTIREKVRPEHPSLFDSLLERERTRKNSNQEDPS
jgi:NhaP-type Na+/H+ or K+/H+ antiporter